MGQHREVGDLVPGLCLEPIYHSYGTPLASMHTDPYTRRAW